MEKKDKHLLTIALIINEQSYMEERVISNPEYENVLGSIEFKLQELLSLNQMVFPYESGQKVKITGQTISQFTSLDERISLEKRLYTLLFDKEIHPKILKWALAHSHTGSRRNYWPHLYNDINESVPGNPFQRRTRNCALRPGSRGSIHEVYTGVVIRSSKNEVIFVEKTEVTFWPLSEMEIEWYISTKEPYDKAGAYGIQSIGAMFVHW